MESSFLRGVRLCALCATLVLALFVAARAGDTIRIWKVGSPHTGDTPDQTMPPVLSREAAKRGFRLSIESFPAPGFAARFAEAVATNAAPDVIVFDNFGVMDGITTGLGTFEGIGRDPTVRAKLLRVTGALDELLPPQRGWTYLFSSSPNHSAARALAMPAPTCANESSGSRTHEDLADLLPTIATSYLEGDAVGVQAHSDAERLPSIRVKDERLSVETVRTCGSWGNKKLAFAAVSATYDAENTLGQTQVLMIFRRPATQWQLLVAARDPITNGEFGKQLPLVDALLTDANTSALPAPATLLSPPSGSFPQAKPAQRFGTFRWRSSPSDSVVVELIEFAYHDDARLFLWPSVRPGFREEISAGRLWTTKSDWKWRVWSITRAGDVVFSDAWTFPH